MRFRFVFVVLVSLCETQAAAAPSDELELVTPAGAHRGRLVTHHQHRCWLVDEAGELAEIPLDRVIRYGTTGRRFRPLSAEAVRDRLKRSVERDVEVRKYGHHVVVAPRGLADEIARLLDDVAGSFRLFCSRRRMRIDDIEFPLVTVVHGSRERFVAQLEAEGVSASESLQGYYHRKSNRISIWIDAATTDSAELPEPFRQTLIHEAIHQLAFNCGLHSRIGDQPLWVVEGLAMLLETDARRTGERGSRRVDRVNPERFVRFRNFAATRRKKDSLEEFVSSDDLFRTAALDAYSEAWALSFFLCETRPAEYNAYLRLFAGRDPLKPYDKAERLADFQTSFSKDVRHLEMRLLQFHRQIEP